ncbi:MAG TPA: hypothetical protein VEW48_05290 [Thermoanaerobaculia bacterium]|nr:hypothetical protein [Thermoanaerobaculia bacterium]
MSDVERATRTRLQRAVEILETLDGELTAIGTGLPASDREDLMYAGEEDWDFPTEVRSVIECVRADWIGPAIRDLRDAAAYEINGNDERD